MRTEKLARSLEAHHCWAFVPRGQFGSFSFSFVVLGAGVSILVFTFEVD